MDSDEVERCDGCGNNFPKSELQKCSHCGAVLCPECRNLHECFTNRPPSDTTAYLKPSNNTGSIKKDHIYIGIAIILCLVAGIFLITNADTITDAFRPDPHIKLDTEASGDMRSIITFDVGSGDTESVTVTAEAEVYRGAKQPKSREVGSGNYWVKMTEDEAQDEFYDTLVAQFNEIKQRRGFTDDQYVEMITSFVQTIPYDTVADTLPQYPVVTAIDNLGDCDETSMLLAGILSHAGYDVALLYFPEKKHMTAGIKCSDGYSYADGYAVIETTNEGWYVSQTNFTYAATAYPIGTGTKTYGSASQVQAIVTYFNTLKQKWGSIESEVNTSLDDARSIITSFESLAKERKGINDQMGDLNHQYTSGTISYDTYKSRWDTLKKRYDSLTQQMTDLEKRYDSSYDTYTNTLDSRNDWAKIYNALNTAKVCDRTRMYQLITAHPLDM